jgi:hypothetical protein
LELLPWIRVKGRSGFPRCSTFIAQIYAGFGSEL